MEAPKTIAHEIGGGRADALRFGLQGVKSDIVGSHPLESASQSVIPLSPLLVLAMLCLVTGKLYLRKMILNFRALIFCFSIIGSLESLMSSFPLFSP